MKSATFTFLRKCPIDYCFIDAARKKNADASVFITTEDALTGSTIKTDENKNTFCAFCKYVGQPYVHNKELENEEAKAKEFHKCSGVLVGNDLVATTAHCVPGLSRDYTTGKCKVDDDEIKRLRIVFDYRLRQRSEACAYFGNGAVYDENKVVGCGIGQDPRFDRIDWALIKLKKPATNSATGGLLDSVKISKAVSVNLPTYLIGYPQGLPLKLSDYGKVTTVKPIFFGSSVYVLHGNSGSPLFNNNKNDNNNYNKMIGLLVGMTSGESCETGKFMRATLFADCLDSFYSRGGPSAAKCFPAYFSQQ